MEWKSKWTTKTTTAKRTPLSSEQPTEHKRGDPWNSADEHTAEVNARRGRRRWLPRLPKGWLR